MQTGHSFPGRIETTLQVGIVTVSIGDHVRRFNLRHCNPTNASLLHTSSRFYPSADKPGLNLRVSTFSLVLPQCNDWSKGADLMLGPDLARTRKIENSERERRQLSTLM
jgi:hypothetical protein